MWNPILFLLLIFTEGNYENEVSTQKPLTPGGSGLLTRHVFKIFGFKKLIYKIFITFKIFFRMTI